MGRFISQKERNIRYLAGMKNRVSPFSLRQSIAYGLMIISLAGCSSGSEHPVQDAAAAIERQDYAAARIHLMTALKKDSQEPEANYLFAKTLIELGDGEGAEAALRKLDGVEGYEAKRLPLLGKALLLKGQNDKALELAANPSGTYAAEMFAIKAMAQFALGQPEAAEASLATGLAAAPDHAELLWIIGNRNLEIGNLDAAAGNAAAALKQSPESMEALLLSGRISLAKADGKKALEIFSKVRELRPDNMAAEYLRGAILLDFGQREEARQGFETVVANSPMHPWATYFLAQMDFDDGDTHGAFNRIQNSKADLSQVPLSLRLTGFLELQRGNVEQAIEKLNRYLSTHPADAETASTLARALVKAGNHKEAYGVIAPVAGLTTAPLDVLKLAGSLAGQTDSETAGSYADRAAALEKDPARNAIFQAEQALIAQDWAKAAKLYDELLSQPHPQKLMLLNNAAMVQLNLSKGDQAIKLARQALALVPDDPMVKDTLGWILLQTRKDKEQALRLIQQAADAAPQNMEIRWHLANALAANGQKESARTIVASLEAAAQGDQKIQLGNLRAWL